ncbi:MAG: 5'/3'-nucleotidase SurE [Xanthomonadaceae bacterium]|nr:5'/3'-nucleotidase SurE [Xanthomonadaceae bacterium]
MQILVTNDDGVHAPGIRHLAHALKEKFKNVVVVAPLEEKSTTGHSLTLHKPLRITEIDKNVYGVNGSPADCVYLAIKKIMKKKPDFVISGINRGSNMGQDVYYSGTVSGAREACIMGIPSIAVSLSADAKANSKPIKTLHFDSAAESSVQLILRLVKQPLPHHTLMNLNVPNLPLGKIKGFKAGKQGFRYYGGKIIERVDHRGSPYFWIGGQYEGFKNESDTDCDVVAQGYAALTPLQLDSTDYSFLREFEADK